MNDISKNLEPWMLILQMDCVNGLSFCFQKYRCHKIIAMLNDNMETR